MRRPWPSTMKDSCAPAVTSGTIGAPVSIASRAYPWRPTKRASSEVNRRRLKINAADDGPT
jgi:hypothetical protein